MLTNVSSNLVITEELRAQVNMDSINFVSNDRLKEVLSATSATPEQVDEAVTINADARLRALKIGFLVMAGLSLIAMIPSGWLPNYRPGQIPKDPHPDESPDHLRELAGQED